jgi:hypothetical protein
MNSTIMVRQRSTALFLLVNLGAIILIFGLIINPARAILADLSSQMKIRSQQLERYTNLVLQEPEVRAQLEKLPMSEKSAYFMSYDKDSDASAYLQTRLREIADKTGLQIRSISAAPASMHYGLNGIAVKIQIKTEISNLHDALLEIENSMNPIMFMHSLAIRAPAMVAHQAESGSVLDARLEVVGVLQ